MLILRSIAFNVLFYLNLFLHIIAALPTFALPRGAFMAVARSWGHTSNVLLRVVAGISVEYRGLKKIPRGALLVASKHQSVWETFTLVTLFDDPAYVFKRELMWIPVFGWYLWKSDMVPVDRRARGGAMAGMIERPDCLVASNTIFRHRSSFPRYRSGRTSVRAVISGTIDRTPSSVAFCRTSSNFSI